MLNLKLAKDSYPTPPQQMSADYAEVRVEHDAVRLLFGQVDTFSRDSLSYVLDVSFPYSQFIRQLFRSIVAPLSPGATPFAQTVRESQRMRKNGRIEAMPVIRSAQRQGHVRANSAALFVYDDEACIDLFHLDAFALHLASLGANELSLRMIMRVVTSPNVLAYFVEAVARAAEEVMDRAPELRREVANG